MKLLFCLVYDDDTAVVQTIELESNSTLCSLLSRYDKLQTPQCYREGMTPEGGEMILKEIDWRFCRRASLDVNFPQSVARKTIGPHELGRTERIGPINSSRPN
jgi:hypothetical protein